MREEAIPEDIVESLIRCASWAPNHKLTEPWRFAILGPETRLRLAQVLLEYRLSTVREENTASAGVMHERIWNRFVRVGAVVAVSLVVNQDDARQVRDDLASVCAAIQNMQLAAWSFGIGACWVNGLVTRVSEVNGLLGLNSEYERLIAVITLGYPAEIPAAIARKDLSAVTRRLP